MEHDLKICKMKKKSKMEDDITSLMKQPDAGPKKENKHPYLGQNQLPSGWKAIEGRRKREEKFMC